MNIVEDCELLFKVSYLNKVPVKYPGLGIPAPDDATIDSTDTNDNHDSGTDDDDDNGENNNKTTIIIIIVMIITMGIWVLITMIIVMRTTISLTLILTTMTAIPATMKERMQMQEPAMTIIQPIIIITTTTTMLPRETKECISLERT